MLKSFSSYFFSSTKKIKSQFNGEVSIRVSRGKKYLNTANTNYSYGSLEKVLRYALHQVDLRLAKEVLVLGMGGGCVLKVLRKEFGYLGNITAVDFDPVIVELAGSEFGITSDNKTKIICGDASTFVNTDETKYDLIIVDLFIDDVVPEQFTTSEFWKQMGEMLNLNGSVIFNTLDDPATDLQAAIAEILKRGMESKIFRNVEQTNRVLIGSPFPDSE